MGEDNVPTTCIGGAAWHKSNARITDIIRTACPEQQLTVCDHQTTTPCRAIVARDGHVRPADFVQRVAFPIVCDATCEHELDVRLNARVVGQRRQTVKTWNVGVPPGHAEALDIKRERPKGQQLARTTAFWPVHVDVTIATLVHDVVAHHDALRIAGAIPNSADRPLPTT